MFKKKIKNTRKNNPTFCDVIKTIILTEKSNNLLQSKSTYLFEVENWANKIIVKNAIKNLFNVRVLKINILNTPSKTKNNKFGTYKKSIRKIAIVKVHSNDNIQLEGQI